MICIRNIEDENLFHHIELGESLGELIPLFILHDQDEVSPFKILRRDGTVIIEPCRPGLKPVPEYLFSGLAPVLVEVTDEKRFHDNSVSEFEIISFAQIGATQ